MLHVPKNKVFIRRGEEGEGGGGKGGALGPLFLNFLDPSLLGDIILLYFTWAPSFLSDTTVNHYTIYLNYKIR